MKQRVAIPGSKCDPYSIGLRGAIHSQLCTHLLIWEMELGWQGVGGVGKYKDDYNPPPFLKCLAGQAGAGGFSSFLGPEIWLLLGVTHNQEKHGVMAWLYTLWSSLL